MLASSVSTRIHRFTGEDIPQVADLHRRVFGIADRPSPELQESYQAYFNQVFLDNPWRNDAVGSLVYQEKNGKVTGFLAMMPRRMVFNGKPIQAGVTSQFVVDPDFRGRVGVELLSAALASSQDLCLADEANTPSRMLWEGFGGVTSQLYSMRWVYPLRPSQFGLFVAEKKRFVSDLLSSILAPAAMSLDALAKRLLRIPALPSVSPLIEENLDCATLLACLTEVWKKQSIHPDYDHNSLNWVLQRAGKLQRNGQLQKVLVKTQKRQVAGWYIYYVNSSGFSEVIHLYAKPGFATAVLDHLFHHAWSRGAVALSGRMEPSCVQAFSDKHCLFHCGPTWVLLHSRNPEVVTAFEQGDAGFSRLEGEWSLHLQ